MTPAAEIVRTDLDGPARSWTQAFYVDALRVLSASDIPFLIGGAFAFARYVGIDRATKDLDVFVRPDDVHDVLDLFRERGYGAELTFPHWLAKVHSGQHFIDVIFSSGNGIARVDDRWFEHAPDGEVLGVPVRLSPPEEMIWSKAFVQERERFDGADVMHLIGQFGPSLDWTRLLERFGPHWRVLLGHLVMFGFVYPSQRDRIPAWVTEELTQRILVEPPSESRICNGTLLSREQYLIDVERSGCDDARLEPLGTMTTDDLEIWNRDIGSGH